METSYIYMGMVLNEVHSMPLDIQRDPVPHYIINYTSRTDVLASFSDVELSVDISDIEVFTICSLFSVLLHPVSTPYSVIQWN